MKRYSEKFVRPLHEAENEFIQVLLSKFLLTRDDDKTICEVSFNDKTPCIWTREGKRHVKDRIDKFDEKVVVHSRQLVEFLSSAEGNLAFDNAEFPFRFASGGTLPVVKMGDEEYFALIYREMFPIGWNLANGGADTSAELLNPFAVVERELREELIILNRKREFRYVFDTESENPIDMPEYLLARQLWKSRLVQKGWEDISRFEPLLIPVKWLDGPDTLKIKYKEYNSQTLKGCYLNIRAEDFGIEVDRIAKINLDANAVLLDGELINGHLVGAPVGLFNVHRMAELLAQGADEFLPDFFFYEGEKLEGSETILKTLVKKFLPRISEVMPGWDQTEWDKCSRPFNLCPVARGILERAAKLWTEKNVKTGAYDVFISFAEPDKELANKVYRHVNQQMGLKTYFSKVSIAADYSSELDKALDSANCLIAVGSSPEHFLRRWLQYEIRSFHKDIFGGIKPESATIIPFLSNMDPRYCPKPLSFYNAIVMEEEDKKALNRLEEIISHAVNKAAT